MKIISMKISIALVILNDHDVFSVAILHVAYKERWTIVAVVQNDSTGKIKNTKKMNNVKYKHFNFS